MLSGRVPKLTPGRQAMSSTVNTGSEAGYMQAAQDQQERIRQAPADRDILVVAGAGSGKTRVMTDRIIKLISEDHIMPEKILGLTFTRKAAGELFSRVSQGVHENLRRRGSQGREDPNALFMHPEVYTYDAFFQSIVRQYGALAGVDSAAVPLSPAGSYQLAGDVVSRTVGAYMSELAAAPDAETPDGGRTPSSGQGSPQDDTGSYTRLIQDTLQLNAEISNSMISPGCQTVAAAAEKVRAWDQEFLLTLGRLAEDVVRTYNGEDALADASNLVFPQKFGPGLSAPEDMEEEKREGYYKSLIGSLQYSTRRRDMLLDMVVAYDEEKRRQGFAEFSDFMIAAFQLVMRYPWIREEYRKKFSHVFLDEYQDTSTTQAKLLHMLFHSADSVSGCSMDSPLRSYVTAVGDPYQSIYAWRGASPGAFRMFLDDYGMDADDIFTMNYTWRNPGIILDAANHLTASMRRNSNAGSIAGPSDPLGRRLRAEAQEVAVKKLSYVSRKNDAVLGLAGYRTRAQEADAIARFAVYARDRARDRVLKAYSGKKAGYTETAENMEKTHVAVLFRSKTHMQEYADAIERAGLTYEIVGNESLWDRPDAQDLLALLAVITDHTDSAAALRLLATPRFGISKEDLRSLSAMAESLNSGYKRQALAQIAAVHHLSEGELRQAKDRLPQGVYLTDLLASGDFENCYRRWRKELGKSAPGALSADGLRRILQVSEIICFVSGHISQPISDIITCAARALTFDIDSAVGQSIALQHAPEHFSPSCAPAFISLAQTYRDELPQGRLPSISGFVAWLTANKENPDMQDSAPVLPSAHPDVVLMTIHQSKGLQWDAVAVAGMARAAFPSSQGEHLGIRLFPRIDDTGAPADEKYADSLIDRTPQGFVLKSTAEDSAGAGRREDTKTRCRMLFKDPQYYTYALPWVMIPTAVPSPVRADSALLPGFPDTAGLQSEFGTVEDLERRIVGGSIEAAVEAAESALRGGKGYEETADRLAAAVRSGDDEAVAGILSAELKRGKLPAGSLASAEEKVYSALNRLYGKHEQDTGYFSLRSETGRQRLDDERRLAYVAFTRAEYDLFLSFCETNTDAKDPKAYDRVHFVTAEESIGGQPGAGDIDAWVRNRTVDLRSHASNFWLELFSHYYRNPDYPVYDIDDAADITGRHCELPVGLFVGEEAGRFRDAVVVEALAESAQAQVVERTAVWPAESSSIVQDVLSGSARLVEGRAESCKGVPIDDEEGHPLARAAVRLIRERRRKGGGTAPQDRRSDAPGFTQADRTGIVNVTKIQEQFADSLGSGSGSEAPVSGKEPSSAGTPGMIHDSVYRPMPQADSLQARRGTEFHAWAQEFILPDYADPDDFAAVLQIRQDKARNAEKAYQEMVHKAAASGGLPGEAPHLQEEGSPDMARWKRNLASSAWSRRRAYAVEQSITDTITGADGTAYHIRGSLDAVFLGHAEDDPASPAPGYYTIVDWKTGHKPECGSRQERVKLAQLDIYRLMFSHMMGIDISHIDAVLYYVDIDNEPDRSIASLPLQGKPIADALAAALEARLRGGTLDDADGDADPVSGMDVPAGDDE